MSHHVSLSVYCTKSDLLPPGAQCSSTPFGLSGWAIFYSLLYPRRVIVLYIYGAMCSDDLFRGRSLHNLHVPTWFLHSPGKHLNLRTSSGTSTTRKKLINQTAVSRIMSAAKPNQATRLFTFPAVAICLGVNGIRLRWRVTNTERWLVLSHFFLLIWLFTHTHTHTHTRTHARTHARPEIAFLKWPNRSLSSLLRQPEPPPPSLVSPVTVTVPDTVNAS